MAPYAYTYTTENPCPASDRSSRVWFERPNASAPTSQPRRHEDNPNPTTTSAFPETISLLKGLTKQLLNKLPRKASASSRPPPPAYTPSPLEVPMYTSTPPPGQAYEYVSGAAYMPYPPYTALISADSIPKWAWRQDQCRAWLADVLRVKLGYTQAHAARIVRRFHGFGPAVYLHYQEDWERIVGKDAGKSVFHLVVGLRNRPGAIPEEYMRQAADRAEKAEMWGGSRAMHEFGAQPVERKTEYE